MKKRILIRMPNWLGDAVMGTPIIQDCKTAWPDAHLAVVAHEAICNLLKHNPFIDEYISFAKENKRSFSIPASFDVGILLTRSFSSAHQFYKANIKERIGYQDHFRSPLLTYALPLGKNEETEHQVIAYKRLLEPLGIAPSTTAPELFLQPDEIAKAKAFLQTFGINGTETLIGINPGASFGSAKCWPEERFVELAHQLHKQSKVRVLFFGDHAGKPLVDAICQKAPANTINLATKTDLRMLIALTSLTHVFISNDSGPMHVAAALKRPLVAIFGSTSAIKTGPYNAPEAVLHAQVACSPCYRRTCPIDFRCMTSITTKDIIDKVDRYLAQ